MRKLIWFFAILTSITFVSSIGSAKVTLSHTITVCEGAASPESSCQGNRKAWLTPPNGSAPPTLKILGNKTQGGENYFLVHFHYQKAAGSGTIIDREGTAWIKDDSNDKNGNLKLSDRAKDLSAINQPIETPKPVSTPTPSPREPAKEICVQCSQHKPAVQETTQQAKAIAAAAVSAQNTDNEKYKLNSETLDYLLGQTGQCMPPKPALTLTDYYACHKAGRGGNNFGYDCNVAYGWKKHKDPPKPPPQFIDQWAPLGMQKKRELNKKDLQVIDGLARTIFGETRGCFPESRGPAGVSSADLTNSGGHAEMAATVTLARALLIQKKREGQKSGPSDIRWMEFRRPDDAGDYKSPFHPLESVVSKPYAYSVWNIDKIVLNSKGKKVFKSTADNSLELVSCPEKDENNQDARMTPAWKKAVELAAQAYMDPASFMNEHKWIFAPKTHIGKDNQIYFYNHRQPGQTGELRRLSHTELHTDKKTGEYIVDPKTRKPKVFVVQDWNPLSATLTENANDKVGYKMEKMRDGCRDARFYEPEDWSK